MEDKIGVPIILKSIINFDYNERGENNDCI